MSEDRYKQIVNDDGAITVRILEPGHLGKNCQITTISENKRLSSCFAKGPIIKIQLSNRWKL